MVRIVITAFGVANKIKNLCDLPNGVKLDILNMSIYKYSNNYSCPLCGLGWENGN